MFFKRIILLLLVSLHYSTAFCQPTFQSVSTAIGAAATAVVNKPAGTVQGDLMVIGVTFEKGSTETITPPAGWTLIRRTNNTTNAGLATYYKIAGAAEGATYSFGLSNGSKWCIGATRISNANSTTPVSVSGDATGNGSTVGAPSITTLNSNNLILCFYTNKKNSTYTPDAATTERYDVPNAAGGIPSNMMATFVLPTVGASGTKNALATDVEFWAAQQIAIAPQISPGGSNVSLTGWYRGDAGVTSASSRVSAWADQSGNGRNATQATAADQPLVTNPATGFNYNPVISFDGQTENLGMADQMPAASTGLTAFVVARQTAATGDPYGVLLCGQGTYPGVGGGYGILAANSANTGFAFAIDTYTNYYVADFVNSLALPTLMTGNWNGTTAGNLQYFNNGVSQGTDAYAGTVGDAGPSYIGMGVAGGQFCFYGDIAEVAIYSVGLSATNTQKVESYLGLKYGITKSGNYLNSSGTTVYTNASPYNNNIVGIGRDDNTFLNQKQSHSYDDTVRVHINNNIAATNAANVSTFSSDNQFIVVGSNNGRLSGQFTEKPASVFSRLGREWKITNTGFTGTFDFDFMLNSIADLGSINGAHLRLLVDDDGDFSNATVYNLGINYSNPWVEINSISNTEIPVNTTRFITIASNNSNSPLPVELLSFEALLCGEKVCIEWKTASEKYSDRFEVERSKDGSNWSTLAVVKAAGTSSQKHEYNVTDNFPFAGISYYRLKQVDSDGTFEISSIVSMNFQNENSDLVIYPNPSDDHIMVENINSNLLTVYDSFGRDVTAALESDVVAGKLKLSTSQLPEGVYFIRYGNPVSENKMTKFLVKHW